MGYTHYYRTNRTKFGETEKDNFDNQLYPKSDEFRSKRKEFQQAVYKICEEARAQGIHLGNGSGEYYPCIQGDAVFLNGSTQQPSNKRVHNPNPTLENASDSFANTLGGSTGAKVMTTGAVLQRPSDEVSIDFKEKSAHVDNRFAGALLTTASIGNPENKPYVDASYETLGIKSYIESNSRGEDKERKFGCTKTNYYPYDVVVTAVLIALYVIFGPDYIKISSDGYKKDRVAGGLLAKRSANIDRYKFYLEGEEIEHITKEMPEFHISHISNAKYDGAIGDVELLKQKGKIQKYEYKGRTFNLYKTALNHERKNKPTCYVE